MSLFARNAPTPRYTLRQEAYDLIKHALLAGEVKPGRVLSANAISTELDMSNSPVREALMDLVGEGLLEVVRNRGFRVHENSEDDRREIHQMRSIIEVTAMQRLAERGLTDAEIVQARRLCAATVEPSPGDTDEAALSDEPLPHTVRYLDADQDMHMFLIGLLDNARLTATVRRLRDQTRVGGALVDMPQSKVSWWSSEHTALIDGLVARDVEKVGRVMRRHVDAVHDYIVEEESEG
ncbi:GntR family transcriptional regulator [Brevibacterium litoralis]|uniref:GntR family transcriptional regulator n=1 Tax=Brevibacterium litoralis TaxID=3138935 RepID=UPI0032EDF274